MKLHLGCGPNYRPGWLNVDLDSACADQLLDLRQPLPFPDKSVGLIFNEHFLEHITHGEGVAFLKECRRVLRDDGVLRISTPDLRWLVGQYVGGALAEWADVGWQPRTACQLMNEGMRLWGHQFVYDKDELFASLRAAGFVCLQEVAWRDSEIPELRNLECRPFHRELIVEAR